MIELTNKNYTEEDINNILNILDGFGSSEVGRLKLKMDEEKAKGEYTYVYHHGRCDIGSPYAKGECFDAPTSDCDR